MIDGTKMNIIGVDRQRLLESERLDFKQIVSRSTGELSPKYIAKYHHCSISLYDNSTRVYFSGSIHKMYNSLKGVYAPNHRIGFADKGFNGNQFAIIEVQESLAHITELIGCDLNQMVFENLEIGVNIEPLFHPRLYIDGLLYHKNKGFDTDHDGNYAQVKHENFFIKIYYKSLQYGMNTEVIRVELKAMRTRELKDTGVRTADDINECTMQLLGQHLLKRFYEIVHYDRTIQKSELTSRQKALLGDYAQKHYWLSELKPINRDRHKKRLVQITLKHSQQIHLQLGAKIKEKCLILHKVLDGI